jgi:undecaprenyl-diphosphatase
MEAGLSLSCPAVVRPPRFVALALIVPLLFLSGSAGAQGDDPPDPETADELFDAANELTVAKAVILGLVEGVTEYLPVSSTGHLLVTNRILDLGRTERSEQAIKDYTIVIQAGAILAVLGMFWKRVRQLLDGFVGRNAEGRRLLVNLVLAFLPAVVLALLFDDAIESRLLETGPVIAAWLVGGVAILFLARRFGDAAKGAALDALQPRQALLIGLAQAVAMWPGTSRSLVTIVAGLLVGLSVGAAVEFSFLLGLATLTAATGYVLLTDGAALFDTFGVVNPLIGMAAALVAAVVAVKWMVGYLQRRSLAVFGWYRIGVGLATLTLVGTGAI